MPRGPADFHRHCASFDPDVVDHLLSPRTSRHSRGYCYRIARRLIPLGEFSVPILQTSLPPGGKAQRVPGRSFPPGGKPKSPPATLFPQGELSFSKARHFFSPWGNTVAGLWQTFADPKHLFPPGGNRRLAANSDVVGSCRNESRSEPFFSKPGE